MVGEPIEIMAKNARHEAMTIQETAQLAEYLKCRDKIGESGEILTMILNTLSPRITADVEEFWANICPTGDNRTKVIQAMIYLKRNFSAYNLAIQIEIENDLELTNMGVAETAEDVQLIIDMITDLKKEAESVNAELSENKMKASLFRRLPVGEKFDSLRRRATGSLVTWKHLKEIFLKEFLTTIERANGERQSSSAAYAQASREEEQRRMMVNMVDVQRMVNASMRDQRWDQHRGYGDEIGRRPVSRMDEYGDIPARGPSVDEDARRARNRSTERDHDRKRERTATQDEGNYSQQHPFHSECREYCATGKCTHEERTGLRCRYAHIGGRDYLRGTSLRRSDSKSPERSVMPSMVPPRSALSMRPLTPGPKPGDAWRS